jgi:hypothetical protein
MEAQPREGPMNLYLFEFHAHRLMSKPKDFVEADKYIASTDLNECRFLLEDKDLNLYTRVKGEWVKLTPLP